MPSSGVKPICFLEPMILSMTLSAGRCGMCGRRRRVHYDEAGGGRRPGGGVPAGRARRARAARPARR